MEENKSVEQVKDGSKTPWMLIGVGIIVIIAVILVFKGTNNSGMPEQNPADGSASVVEPESTQDLSDAPAIGAQAASLSYAQALVKYADRRIQFDKDCRATPDTVTYKDHTGIMLDNRSAITRTIKVGTNYTVKAYGFKIVVLPDVYLKSKTLLVDCGLSQNVATILVQE